jgi:hypothetical protein
MGQVCGQEDAKVTEEQAIPSEIATARDEPIVAVEDPIEKGRKVAGFAVKEIEKEIASKKAVNEAWDALRKELETQKSVWESPLHAKNTKFKADVDFLVSKLESSMTLYAKDAAASEKSLQEALDKSDADEKAFGTGGALLNNKIKSLCREIMDKKADEARLQLIGFCVMYKDQVGTKSGTVFEAKGMTGQDVEDLVNRCKLTDHKLDTTVRKLLFSNLKHGVVRRPSKEGK